MKKKVIIALLLIFASAFIYKIWMDNALDVDDNASASFTFGENLSVITQNETRIGIKINNSDLLKVEIGRAHV